MTLFTTASRRLLAGLGTGAVVAALALTPQPNVQAAPSAAPAAATQAGVDSPSEAAVNQMLLNRARMFTGKPRGLNPYTSVVPRGQVRDYRGWWLAGQQEAKQRVVSAAHKKARAGARLVAPLAYSEKEASGKRGVNDTVGSAELLEGFGTATNPAVRIKGGQAPEVIPANKYVRIAPTKRKDNRPSKARDTGISAKRDAVKTKGGISKRDSDWYRLTLTEASRISVDMKATSGTLEPFVAILDEDLNFVTDSFDEFGKKFTIGGYAAKPGRYFVVVLAWNVNGKDTTGKYQLGIAASEADRDLYAMQLNAGDVVAATSTNVTQVTVFGEGTERHTSPFDVSFIYPIDSPLMGGRFKPLTDFVAPSAGRYYFELAGDKGAYQADLEVYPYGGSTAPQKQTIFLDTDGARVNTRIWDSAAGPATLSPLSAFLDDWGLQASDEAALVAGIKANVEENLRQDLVAAGLSERVDVDVVTSQDGVDLTGKPGVTTIIVGGTIEESDLFTIGIAQSIDPGNFAQSETGLVLLDLLSGPDTKANEFRDVSLNHFIKPASDKVGFIAQAVGNISSHEAGHMLGNWHTEPFNEVPAIMDAGGNFEAMFGVGADKIGGTADDVNVDFEFDIFDLFEGFSGQEDTVARTSWAVSR